MRILSKASERAAALDSLSVRDGSQGGGAREGEVPRTASLARNSAAMGPSLVANSRVGGWVDGAEGGEAT